MKDREDWKAFAGQKCTIQDSGGQVDDPDVHILKNDGLEGLSRSRNALRTGGNSGYQALGLAIAAGARRVILLGYDMSFPGGKSHWHGGHPTSVGEQVYRATFAHYFKTIRTDIEILNASAGSALKCFQMVALDTVL